jgi:threonine dehydratase
MGKHAISTEDIVAARAVGRGIVKHTPITESYALSDMCGGSIILKAENLQRTGSFKVRGALNKLHSLGSAVGAGVTAGSAGNHAQAIAFAARHHGVPCQIFVPAGASLSKIEQCRTYGATVVEGGDTLDDAVSRAKEHAASTGMHFCHPFDDPVVVAGQGTLGLELLEDIADLHTVIIPLGGGGLTAGTAIAVKTERPHVRVIGVQVAACAPYAGRPPADGPIVTLADGIAVKKPGEVTAPLIEEFVDEVVVVAEDTVADAMVLLMDRGKFYVEGGGAVGVSALLTRAAPPASCCPAEMSIWASFLISYGVTRHRSVVVSSCSPEFLTALVASPVCSHCSHKPARTSSRSNMCAKVSTFMCVKPAYRRCSKFGAKNMNKKCSRQLARLATTFKKSSVIDDVATHHRPSRPIR